MKLLFLITYMFQDKKEISFLWIFASKDIIFIRLMYYWLLQDKKKGKYDKREYRK